jgi:heat shock protein HslJ
MRAVVPTVLAVLAIAACAASPVGGQARAPVADREWQLVALGAQSDPLGAGARPPTLRLDSKERRASGFAGCNRFSGGFALEGERLSFGSLLSTKMACESGMDVEVAYLDALGRVESHATAAGELVLRTRDGGALRFRPADPLP